MSAMLSFLKGQPAFEPEATQAMSAAFDDVCKTLNLVSPAADRARVVIAERIIELARRGERDPARLRERVLREADVAEPLDQPG